MEAEFVLLPGFIMTVLNIVFVYLGGCQSYWAFNIHRFVLRCGRNIPN